jgi:hypothetical protein
VVDYSVDSWADTEVAHRGAFLSSYYQWKLHAPVIQSIMLVLLAMLPFVVVGMVKEDVLGLFNKAGQRSRARHAWGTANLAGIIAVIAYIVLAVSPAEDAVRVAGAAGGAGEAAVAHLKTLHGWHVINNIVLAMVPFFKFAAATQAAAAGDAGASATGAAGGEGAAPASDGRRSGAKRKAV